MLKSLSIKNYALIQSLEISPAKGFNIITGETGAGKSIMLGALGLLLGKRADTKSLFDPDEKCIIEGVFKITDEQIKRIFDSEDLDFEENTIIRREITPSGKSRAFVNDTPVTLDILKKLGLQLIDIHSQHETLNLGKQSFQLAFIDAYSEATTLRKNYQKQFRHYEKSLLELQKHEEEVRKLKQEADFVAFQLEELQKLNLQPDEQETLEDELAVLEHAEEIKQKLSEALNILRSGEYSAEEGLSTGKVIMDQLLRYGESYKTMAERLSSALIEVQDVITEIEREEGRVEVNPEQTAAVQERLSSIYSLQKKHGVQSIQELLQLQNELEARMDKFVNADDETEALKNQTETHKAEAEKLALELSNKRRDCFDQLSKELVDLLAGVGMEEARIEVDAEKTPLGPYGIDAIDILFSANKGVSTQPVARVASGGEYSRLMFCVKYILAQKIELPTIVFDEIDTGVSGEIGIKLGDMMKKMATRHQVIIISHLPQIAAKGERHYFVYKDSTDSKTVSKIRDLDQEERIVEIAKMLSGENPTEGALVNARELIGE